MSARRLGVIAFAVALVAGVAGLAIRGADTDTTLRASLSNFPVQLLAILEPGQDVCQQPVSLPPRIDRVRLVVAPGREVRGPVRVDLRRMTDDDVGATIAEGTIPRRRLTGNPVDVPLSPATTEATRVAVCVTLLRGEPLEVWGEFTGPSTPSDTTAVRDGEPLEPDADLYLEFPRGEPRSVLSQIPAALRNAAPFKLGGMGAWVFWGLGVVLVLTVVALARAIGRAGADER